MWRFEVLWTKLLKLVAQHWHTDKALKWVTLDNTGLAPQNNNVRCFPDTRSNLSDPLRLVHVVQGFEVIQCARVLPMKQHHIGCYPSTADTKKWIIGRDLAFVGDPEKCRF